MSSSKPDLASLITLDPGLPRPSPTASHWQTPPHSLSNIRSPSLPQTTSIAIIGSGITGASVAKAILEHDPAVHVTVFEARTLCSGATGRNGGQLAISAPERYLGLKEKFGKEMAGKIVRFYIKTLDAVREVAVRFRGVGMDPEVNEVVKIRAFLSDNEGDAFLKACVGIDELETDHPDLKGLFKVLLEGECRDYGIHGATGAILHPAGTIWPYRVVTNLFDALLTNYPDRLAIETNTPVTKVAYNPDTDPDHPYIIHTPRGTVRAAQVAHCTNGYTGHLLPRLRGSLYPVKGTMTVQERQPSASAKPSTSWAIHYQATLDEATGAYADGLIYGMQSPSSGMYFFGGEKSPLDLQLSADDTEAAHSQTTVHFLQESLATLFGHSPTEYNLVTSWSGIMGFSADSLPLVGRLPTDLTGRPGNGEWIAAAYNGYGMPAAWLVGESLGLMMVGKERRENLPEAFLLTEERVRDSMLMYLR
ncbi:NAD(P)/FAD-dependent oxidoreductase [Aspergillus mulundensis]|uniref:FAD dependent oxidoreductase n=1 Tax=Aspergillus mulundensis TaxID=1810919 RepID=A0A3D8RF69_9EURO|nr:FAD dependent oxidoreductase [Aspergillus mulundensis]RDW72588.1 FAD dependent oxidoreductase [Aspergillus mulundensis]